MARKTNAEMSGVSPEEFEKDMMEIACRLVAFREFHAVQQTEFYRNVGLPASTASHYERGYSYPSLGYARMLHKRLGLSLDYLYEGKTGALTQDIARFVTKRLPVLIEMFKDRVEHERRVNERKGLGHATNQILNNAREKQRMREMYAAAKGAQKDAAIVAAKQKKSQKK
jgi:transcriptional regulator with XRE-family HTH domain